MSRFAPLALLFALSGAPALLGAAPDALPAPVVVVYPLTQTSGASSDAGSNVAILLATKLAQLGGITIKPFTAGTQRPQYLENALKEDADYYVTGFLTPVGAEVSMISQVVSTHSGSVVYSTTIAARTYADAAGQADLLHDAILRHAGRGLPALDAPPPAPSSTPAPEASSGGFNLLKALGHHARSPAPAATSSAVAARPAAVALAPPAAGKGSARSQTLVVEAGGDTDATTRASLATDLAKALAHHGYVTGYLPVAESEVRAHAKDLCSANAGTRVLLTSTLALGRGSGAARSVQLDVTAYDCAGGVLGRQRALAAANTAAALPAAMRRATVSAADAIAKAAILPKPGS